MEHEFKLQIMLGVVAKTAVYGALLVVGGPAVAGAGAIAANAIADGVGAAVEGIESNKDLRERLMDAMRDALDESFDASAKKSADPCEFGPTVRKVVRRGLLQGEGEVVADPGADGTTALFGLVSQACALCPSVSASEEAKRWLVNDFFERLQGKMLSDNLMCNLLIYRTILYGFSSMFPQLQDVKAHLDRIESAIKAILSSCGPDSAVATLLKFLEYLDSEGIPLWEDGAEGDNIEEWFQNKLEAALTEAQAKVAQGQTPDAPIKMTPIPGRGVLVGRDSELAQVDELLEKEGIVVVRGDGGIGKTSLVAALVNGHIPAQGPDGEDSFSRFAWIKSTGSLRSDLARIDTEARNGKLSLDERAEAAIGWLRSTRERTLLAIDGMDAKPTDEDGDVLDGFSPAVKVLVTSRADLGMGEAYVLKPMDLDQSTRMFYAYFLGKSKAPALVELETKDEYPTAREIVGLCDGNALLIELIAKAARSEGGRLQDYWEERGVKVFEDEDASLDTEHARSRGKGADTLRGQVSRLYALSGLTESQERAMALLVQFPPEVPIYYKLRDWAGISQDDMNRLATLGWVERREGSYSVHQVVRESVLLQLEASGATVNPMDYGNLVSEVLNADGYLNVMEEYEAVTQRIVIPETIERLLDGATEPASVASDMQLCHLLGKTLSLRGELEVALTYEYRALQLSRQLLGADNPFAMAVYSSLGHIFDEKDVVALSVTYFLMAKRIAESVCGADSAEAARIALKVALVYSRMGLTMYAKDYLEEAVRGFEDALGPSDPETAEAYASFGDICMDMGDNALARDYLERAADLPKAPFGASHPRTRSVYARLALVNRALGDNEQMRRYQEKATKGLEAVPDVDGMETVMGYNALISALVALGDMEHARMLQEAIAKWFEALFGTDNYNTATAYACLGAICNYLEDYERARDYFERAIVPLEAACNANRRLTLNTYLELGDAYLALGDEMQARKSYDEVERGLDAESGATGFTAGVNSRLAGAYIKMGDTKRAEERFKEASRWFEATFGANGT